MKESPPVGWSRGGSMTWTPGFRRSRGGGASSDRDRAGRDHLRRGARRAVLKASSEARSRACSSGVCKQRGVVCLSGGRAPVDAPLARAREDKRYGQCGQQWRRGSWIDDPSGRACRRSWVPDEVAGAARGKWMAISTAPTTNPVPPSARWRSSPARCGRTSSRRRGRPGRARS